MKYAIKILTEALLDERHYKDEAKESNDLAMYQRCEARILHLEQALKKID